METGIQINNEQLKNIANILATMPNSLKNVTNKQFENEYLSYIKCNHSKAYHISNEISFKHYLAYFPGDMKLYSITQREIEKFIDALKKHAPKGFRVYYRNIKAAFNKAIDWGYINTNPFKKIRLPKQQINKPEFITEAELSKILTHIEERALKIGCSKNRKRSLLIVADVVKTAFFTGMRLSELNNLRWENVKLEKEYLIVGDNKFTTKGKKQRIIPIDKKMVELLTTRKSTAKTKDDFVFSLNGKKVFSNDYVSKTFKSICRETGIDEIIRFHSLRHSFASNLAQRGVSAFQLKELLGHSSVAVTEKYSHMTLESLREAISKFNIGDKDE